MIENYTRFLIYDMKFTLIKIKQKKIEVVLKPPLSLYSVQWEFCQSFFKDYRKQHSLDSSLDLCGSKKISASKKVLCSVVNDLTQGLLFQQLVEKIENIHYIGRDHLYPCIITRLI